MVSNLFERLEPTLLRLEKRFEELDSSLSSPEIATDGLRMAQLLRERGRIEDTVRSYRQIRQIGQDLREARSELASSSDPAMVAYCEEMIADLSARWESTERDLLADFTRDEDDAIDEAIIEIRAGTGGDEASLWAADLLRMYTRLCERRGWKLELLDESRSSADGVKEAVLAVKGRGAYALLKYESGGHRVQRVPETESQGRIHTSMATVAVLPEASEVEVDIDDGDLRIDAFRSSGPGGQSVNKTSSAIRVTHIPTGVVVSCQDEKSQHKNKAKALRILRTRLYDLERQRLHSERSTQRKTLIGTGDRSARIRTYNFPDARVSDHRIKLNVHDLASVLDGQLDVLIDSLAEHDREQRLQALASELS